MEVMRDDASRASCGRCTTRRTARLVVQLFALTGDLADAEDAVQEAFVEALGKGRRIRRRWTIPRPGCARLALNHVRNRWRHAEVVRRLRTKVPGPTPGVEVGPEHVALVEALRRARPASTALSSCSTTSPTDAIADISIELGVPEKELSSLVWRAVESCSRRCCPSPSCPSPSCPSLSCPSLGRRIMSSFGSDLQVLREVGQPRTSTSVRRTGRRAHAVVPEGLASRPPPPSRLLTVCGGRLGVRHRRPPGTASHRRSPQLRAPTPELKSSRSPPTSRRSEPDIKPLRRRRVRSHRYRHQLPAGATGV